MNVIMLNVIMLSVIMLNVVEPNQVLQILLILLSLLSLKKSQHRDGGKLRARTNSKLRKSLPAS